MPSAHSQLLRLAALTGVALVRSTARMVSSFISFVLSVGRRGNPEVERARGRRLPGLLPCSYHTIKVRHEASGEGKARTRSISCWTSSGSSRQGNPSMFIANGRSLSFAGEVQHRLAISNRSFTERKRALPSNGNLRRATQNYARSRCESAGAAGHETVYRASREYPQSREAIGLSWGGQMQTSHKQ